MNEINKFLDNLSEGLEGRAFWEPYRNFCGNIEKAELIKLVAATPKILSRIENDFLASDYYNGIDEACSKDIKFGKALYELISKSSCEKTQRILNRTISGVFKKDSGWATGEVLWLLENEKSIRLNQGIISISNFNLSNPNLENFIKGVDARFSEFIENKDLSADVLASVLCTCRNQRKYLPNADKYIRSLFEREENEIKIQLLYLLDYNIDIKSETDFYKSVLNALLSMNTELKGAYDTLSYTLENEVTENFDIILEFLNAWVGFSVINANNTKLLQPVFNKIYNLKPVYFQKLITEWLNDDSINFQLAIFGIIRELSYGNVETIKLDKNLLQGYSLFDIEFIARKIIGFVYEKDLSTSMLFSIIEAKYEDESTVNYLADIFVNHLIFNYYSTVDYLNGKKKNAPKKLKKIIDEIISDGKRYYDSYSKLELFKEFDPSEVRLNYISRLRSKKFSKSYNDSEKNSGSFSSLFTTLHFRVGKTSFAKFDGKYTAHMEPKLISHSTEMPRGEYIDPVGQAQLRLESQAFKRRK